MSGVLDNGAGLAGPATLADTPGRNRIYLLPLFGVLLLGLLGWLWWTGPDDNGSTTAPPAAQLAGRSLQGARGPACIRLVIAVDVSGSMGSFAGARDAALTQLFQWSHDNLRASDEIAVVDFAADSVVRLAPTRMDKLRGLGGAAGASDGQYTNLIPALQTLDGFGRGDCDTEVVMIGDAQLVDLPSDQTTGQELLRQHRVHDLRLLVPGDDIDVPQVWTLAFPEAAPTRFDGNDPDATALAFGQAIAGLTGQTLR